MTVNPTAHRPGMFSPVNANLQIAWDATCMSAMNCPRNYQLSILQGWRKTSVHLDFGGFVADGFETYQKARLDGKARDQAILIALRKVLELSWNDDGTQWGGYWEEQWKCDGTKPYKNAKGNKAKCPYSHKRMWFPPPAPDVCGECGAGIVSALNYCPDHSTKHRVNLARAIVWYGLDQPEALEDGLHPYKFPDGTPAVELSWRVPMPTQSPYGDTYLLCGHFDYIGQYGSELGPVDNKTTKYTLGSSYFKGFAPSVQFDTYDMVAPILFPDLDFSWVAIDALQILTDTIRTGRHFYRKSQDQRAEHFKSISWIIGQAEQYAQADYWPMNKSACAMCSFKDVCTLPPEDRKDKLHTDYITSFWTPLDNR
jgi:hypothetical protein